jgi:hypothetical protein
LDQRVEATSAKCAKYAFTAFTPGEVASYAKSVTVVSSLSTARKEPIKSSAGSSKVSAKLRHSPVAGAFGELPALRQRCNSFVCSMRLLIARLRKQKKVAVVNDKPGAFGGAMANMHTAMSLQKPMANVHHANGGYILDHPLRAGICGRRPSNTSSTAAKTF